LQIGIRKFRILPFDVFILIGTTACFIISFVYIITFSLDAHGAGGIHSDANTNRKNPFRYGVGVGDGVGVGRGAH
jgi:hypothetical protein